MGHVTIRPLLVASLMIAAALSPASSDDPCRPAPPEAMEVEQDIGLFRQATDAYIALRGRLALEPPGLAPSGDLASDRAVSLELRRRIAAERWQARQGDLFTPPLARQLRRCLILSLGPADFRDLLEHLGEEWEGSERAKAAVNAVYPETAPLSMMSPVLLGLLPPLPEPLQYSFLGHDLVLLDADLGLIVDYLPDAIPSDCRLRDR